MQPKILYISLEPHSQQDIILAKLSHFNLFLNEQILESYKLKGFIIDYSRDLIINFLDLEENSPYNLFMNKVIKK